MSETNDTVRWDTWNSAGGPKYPHDKVIQFLFRRYPDPQIRMQRDVLDLGCGSGVHMMFLTREGFRAHGRDISPVAIRNTLQSLTAAGLQAASLAVGSVDQIDASDESFDAILCIGVLDCAGAARLSAALGEIVRVLRPGGSALAVFASDKDFRCQGANPLQIHGFSDDEVKDAVSAACANAKAVWTDRFITTYENMKIQQNEHLLTIIK